MELLHAALPFKRTMFNVVQLHYLLPKVNYQPNQLAATYQMSKTLKSLYPNHSQPKTTDLSLFTPLTNKNKTTPSLAASKAFLIFCHLCMVVWTWNVSLSDLRNSGGEVDPKEEAAKVATKRRHFFRRNAPRKETSFRPRIVGKSHEAPRK